MSLALEKLECSSIISASAVSPGIAKGKKTAFPSEKAIPSPFEESVSTLRVSVSAHMSLY